MTEQNYQSSSFAFRVDSSEIIGTGHVMRCLTLANSLRNAGASCFFICRDHAGNVTETIRQYGYEAKLLPITHKQKGYSVKSGGNSYFSWLGASVDEDAKDCISIIKTSPIDWLIVDHYAINLQWHDLMKQSLGIKIMVIDGQANRRHNCDLLLDPALSQEGKKRWEGLVPPNSLMFVGPEHALLRDEFRIAKEKLRQRNDKVNRIFIGFGGVDKTDATGTVLESVLNLGLVDIAIDIVVGPAYPHLSNLRSMCVNMTNINIHVNTPNVADLMSNADLAVGGGGGMMLERCFLNLPSITISIAENQIMFAKAMHATGATNYIGCIESLTTEKIQNAIKSLFDNQSALRKMQINTEQLLQHTGPRLVPTLLEAKI